MKKSKIKKIITMAVSAAMCLTVAATSVVGVGAASVDSDSVGKNYGYTYMSFSKTNKSQKVSYNMGLYEVDMIYVYANQGSYNVNTRDLKYTKSLVDDSCLKILNFSNEAYYKDPQRLGFVKVQAYKKGTSSIYIGDKNNSRQLRATITVKNAPSWVKIYNGGETLGASNSGTHKHKCAEVGDTFTVKECTNSGSWSSPDIQKWRSSNTNVATIKGDNSCNKAYVTCKGRGTTKISITTGDGKKTAYYWLTVS